MHSSDFRFLSFFHFLLGAEMTAICNQYLISEHDSTTFFGSQKNALFAFESRQLGIDFLDVIHEN